MLYLILFSIDTLKISIDDAVEIAMENNLSVRLSSEEVKKSQYNFLGAISDMFPRIEGKGYYSYVSEVPVIEMFVMDSLLMKSPGVFIPVGHVDTINFGSNQNYSFELSITQPLFTWGKIINGIRLASKNKYITKMQDSLTKVAISNIVKQMYLYTLTSKELLNLTEKIENDMKAHYESAKKQYQSGLITELQYLQAEASYKSQIGNYEQALNRYKEVIDNFKITLGIPLNTEIILTDSLSPELLHFDTTFNEEERYDLKILEKQKESLNIITQLLIAQNFPDISGGFSYSYKYPFGFSNEWKDSWAISLGAHWSFLNHGKNIFELKKNKVDKKKIEFLIENKKKEIKKERDKIMRNYNYAKTMLDISYNNLKVADKLYKTAKEQYNSGFATHLDFMDAEVNYIKGRVSYIQAIMEYLISGMALEQTKYGNIEGGR